MKLKIIYNLGSIFAPSFLLIRMKELTKEREMCREARVKIY